MHPHIRYQHKYIQPMMPIKQTRRPGSSEKDMIEFRPSNNVSSDYRPTTLYMVEKTAGKDGNCEGVIVYRNEHGYSQQHFLNSLANLSYAGQAGLPMVMLEQVVSRILTTRLQVRFA